MSPCRATLAGYEDSPSPHRFRLSLLWLELQTRLGIQHTIHTQLVAIRIMKDEVADHTGNGCSLAYLDTEALYTFALRIEILYADSKYPPTSACMTIHSLH